jgi:O-antigen ligase
MTESTTEGAIEIPLQRNDRIEARAEAERQTAPVSFARRLDRVIFFSLLIMIPLTAIPYGAVEPWWVAVFECAVFLIAILGVIEAFFSDGPTLSDLKLVAPGLALVLYVFLQSLPLFPGAGPEAAKVALSADAYGTRMFAIKLFALVVYAFLLLRHTSSRSKLRALIYVVIGVSVASAVFGILRKAVLHDAGFLLPALNGNSRSFAQFVNRNHFGFLMEMALGLTLGLIIGEVGRRRKLLVFLAIALLLWVALVFSNSRGGILASLCQLLFLGVMLDPVRYLAGRAGTKWTRFQNLIGGVALRVVLVVCLIGVFAYGVGWVGGESVVNNFELAGTAFSQQMTANRANTSRKQIWSTTWQAIKSHPIAGTGFGGYWIAIRKYHDASGEFTPQQAHNDYLELLASGGFFGGALVIWFVVVFVSRARRSLNSQDAYCQPAALGALTGIVGVLIHSFVDFGLHITVNALVFCALIVITVCCSNHAVAATEPRL